MLIQKITTASGATVRAHERLARLVPALQEAGITVHVPDTAEKGLTSFLFIERDGHVGTVQVGSFGVGWEVSMEIPPSIKKGSSAHIAQGADDMGRIHDLEATVAACLLATEQGYRSPIVGPVANQGPKAMAWAKRKDLATGIDEEVHEL